VWRRRGAPGVVECGSEIIRWRLEMRNSGNKLWIRSGRRSEAMAHFVFFCGLLLATAFLVEGAEDIPGAGSVPKARTPSVLSLFNMKFTSKFWNEKVLSHG
jgi:hypothetical protein